MCPSLLSVTEPSPDGSEAAASATQPHTAAHSRTNTRIDMAKMSRGIFPIGFWGKFFEAGASLRCQPVSTVAAVLGPIHTSLLQNIPPPSLSLSSPHCEDMAEPHRTLVPGNLQSSIAQSFRATALSFCAASSSEGSLPHASSTVPSVMPRTSGRATSVRVFFTN